MCITNEMKEFYSNINAFFCIEISPVNFNLLVIKSYYVHKIIIIIKIR